MKFKGSILVAVLLFLLVGCKITIEPNVTISLLRSETTETVVVSAIVETKACDVSVQRKFYFGVLVEPVGCTRIGQNSFQKFKFEIPFIPFSKQRELKGAKVALFSGKNKTLIVYLDRDTLESINQEIGVIDKELKISIRIQVYNDTNLPTKMAADSVWLDDSIAIGQQMMTYTISPKNFTSVTMGETSVAVLLRDGFESIMIIPFEESK